MIKHGMSKTRIYDLWVTMIQRCKNPNATGYAGYGGRGIKVCERWLAFANFYEDMGDKPDNCSLDRIDNNGNYCKENCRWATHAEQAVNKRKKRLQKNNHTGFPGVHWKPSHNAFQARATIAGKRTFLGYFKRLEDAAAAVRIHCG